MTAAFSGLFIMGLVALSYGASQQNALVAIVGIVLMLVSGIGGFVTRKSKR